MYRRVKMKRDLDIKDIVDTPEGQFAISTVELKKFSFFENKYETMVFAAEEGQVVDWEDLFCARYETREEAVKGHRKYFKQLRKGGVSGMRAEN
jgi:hypothetical protein